MNLNNLYYYVIAAEEMNFTKAAERLYISQQAVSLHIKNLEKEMKEAAANLEFERAAELRDMLFDLRSSKRS